MTTPTTMATTTIATTPTRTRRIETPLCTGREERGDRRGKKFSRVN
jgi:hypothetical protein